MTTAASLAQSVAPGVSLGFKNRIINGGMTVNQRALGTFTPTTAGHASNYSIDRWTFAVNQSSKLTTAQSSTAPAGFINSLLVTSSSAYTPSGTDYFALQYIIEGLNIADLAWGTANAKTVTLSFQVYSSLTGTFGGAISNGPANRCYPFSYSIPVANTWTTISVTIPGDTTGTWLTTNGAGIELDFSMGMGSTYGSGTAGAWTTSWSFPSGSVNLVATNGATFYITGVQLEVGTAATNFEFRDYGSELLMCQRYYETVVFNELQTIAPYYDNVNTKSQSFTYSVTKRAAPTITTSSTTKVFVNYGGGAAVTASSLTFDATVSSYRYVFSGSGFSGSGPTMYIAATTTSISAEL